MSWPAGRGLWSTSTPLRLAESGPLPGPEHQTGVHCYGLEAGRTLQVKVFVVVVNVFVDCDKEI